MAVFENSFTVNDYFGSFNGNNFTGIFINKVFNPGF